MVLRPRHQRYFLAAGVHSQQRLVQATMLFLITITLLLTSYNVHAVQQQTLVAVSNASLTDIHSSANVPQPSINSKLQLGSKFQISSEQLPLNSSTASNSFEVQSSSPAIMGQWYFTDANSTIRPYVGAGLNYAQQPNTLTNTMSSSGEFSSDSTAQTSANRYGIASQVGVDYHVSKRWRLNMSVWYLDSKPPQLVEAPSSSTSNSDAEYPWLYIFSVGYSF